MELFAEVAKARVECGAAVEAVDINGGEVVCDTKVSKTLSR